jgi:hypothetical protein
LPLDGIILLVKFENGKSDTFQQAAQEFYSVFGRDAFKSLMLLCIQESKTKTLSEANFEKKLFESDGYKYLVEKNDHQNIQHCVWDNYFPYKDHEKNFKNCLSNLEKFELRQFETSIENAKTKITQLKAEKNTKQSHTEIKPIIENNKLGFSCLNILNKSLFFFIVMALSILMLNHYNEMSKLEPLKEKSVHSIDFNQLKKDYDGYLKENQDNLIETVNKIVIQKNKELLNEINRLQITDIETYITKLNKLFEILKFFSNHIPSLKQDYETKIDKLYDLFDKKIQTLNSLLTGKSTEMKKIKQINSDYDSLQKIVKYLETSQDKRLKKSNELFHNLQMVCISNYLTTQKSLTEADLSENLLIKQIVESIKFVKQNLLGFYSKNKQ